MALHLENGKDPSDQPRRNRPACARKEADAEPDADQIEVDGGGHLEFSICFDQGKNKKARRPLIHAVIIEAAALSS